jgi:hypothetical protein
MSGSDTGAPQKKKFHEHVKEKAIDVLNPKLKQYTKPLTLALLIGGSSLIIFCILITVLIVDCPVMKDGPMVRGNNICSSVRY